MHPSSYRRGASRTELYFRNLFAICANMVLGLAFALLIRWAFVRTLGADLLGLSGLFTSIFAILSLAEFGIGGAAGYSLYAPLARQDDRKVATLLRLFKRIYAVIAGIVALTGVLLLPFLPFFIDSHQSIPNLNALYLISLSGIVLGYLFSHNQILLSADQNTHAIVGINLFFTTINGVVLIALLWVFKSFLVYLVATVILGFLLQLATHQRIQRIYRHLLTNPNDQVPRENRDEIIKNVKATFLHRIGDFVVNSTDNIIISKAIDLASVGYLSNYYLILSVPNRLADVLFKNLIAGIGQLFVEGDRARAISLFTKLNFLSFWLFGLVGVNFFCNANFIIGLLFGPQYVLSNPVVLLLSVNFFVTGMRMGPFVVKTAAGLFAQDRYVPLAQSAVNLLFSIILVGPMGIAGVLLGTLISSIIPTVARPYVAYRYGFDCSPASYFINLSKHAALSAVLGLTSYYACILTFPLPTWSAVFGRLVLCLIAFNAPVLIMYRKSEEISFVKTKASEFCRFLRVIGDV